MKTIPFVISSLLTAKGIYVGQLLLDKTTLAYGNIKYELEKKNIPILDTVSNNSDEEWLVLAQKYRENGTVAVNEPRNPFLWKDPEFISSQRLSEIGVVTNGTNIFTGDEALAIELKTKCAEVLSKSYSHSLYSKASKWCSLYLPESVKSILKLQKNNGDCKLWVIRSSKESTGWFIWEFFEKFGMEKDLLESLNQALVSASYHDTITDQEDFHTKRGRQILDKCKERGPGKFLELSYTNLPTYGLGSGKSFIPSFDKQGNLNWPENKEHKLASSEI